MTGPAEPDVIASPEPGIGRERRRIRAYLSLLDFSRLPESKAGWLVRALVLAFALVTVWRRVQAATRPLLAAKPPAAISTDNIDDYRFQLPERVRREVFTELATAELAERARAINANTWNGHLWSREDDRGYYERAAVHQIAARRRLSHTQVYLVLDEGLRERWPGPDGKPLPATSPPLNIRQTW